MPKKDYSDIINHARPISKSHPHMSINARAAQFSPYAALVGHKDIILHDEEDAENKDDIDRDISIIEDADVFP